MNENSTCPIWRTPATEYSTQGRDAREADSPRAGGRYFISGTAETILKNHDASLKARLTTWLIDHRRLGVDCPEVETDSIKDAEARRPLPIRDRADRFLRYLADREPYPGGGFPALSYEIDGTYIRESQWAPDTVPRRGGATPILPLADATGSGFPPFPTRERANTRCKTYQRSRHFQPCFQYNGV